MHWKNWIRVALIVCAFGVGVLSTPASADAPDTGAVTNKPAATEAGGPAEDAADPEAGAEPDQSLSSLATAGRWLSSGLGVLVLLLVGLRILRRKPALRINDIKVRGYDEEQAAGIQLKDTILSRLRMVATSTETTAIDFVTGPINDIALPEELTAIVPTHTTSWMSPAAWLGALVALVDWLAPARTLTLDGDLHLTKHRGIGATVRLADNGSVVASEVLWISDFEYERESGSRDDVSLAYRLTEYIAIWLLFKVIARVGDREPVLGTLSWHSYALFRAGCYAYGNQRFDAAQVLHQRALDEDPDFHGARVNLGQILLNRPEPWNSTEEDRKAADWHLERAEKLAAERGTYQSDPTLYLAKYLRAVITYRNHGATAAIAPSRKLLILVDELLRGTRYEWPGYGGADLQRYLARIRPAISTMLGALLILDGQVARGTEMVSDAQDRANPNANHQYNQVCALSILLKLEQDKSAPDADRVTALIDDALLHLERAFQLDFRAVHKARKSELLETLRDAAGKRFQSIVNLYDPPPAPTPAPEPEPLPMAAFALIGDDKASALAEAGINTVAELLGHARTPAQRAELDARLNVGVSTILLWARLVELTRIIGIGPPEANLLFTAGVLSLGELGRDTADSLVDRLRVAAEAGDVTPPTHPQTEQWIEDAQTNTLSVLSPEP